MDQAGVQERRLVAENSNLAVQPASAPTAAPASAPATQTFLGGSLVAASQPGNGDMDLTILFCAEPATAPAEAPALAKESVDQEPGKDATSKPAPPVWLKTKAGVQYEK